MSTYALTSSTYERRALFTKTTNAELFVSTLFHYREESRYLLHGFVVMPEHIHVLLTPAEKQTIERCAQCIKGGFSHSMRSHFGGQIWQPGFHGHRIRNATDFANQLAYIAANPQKRGLDAYAFVHTKFPQQLDPPPAHLVGSS